MGFPLALSHAHCRRILDRRATALILARRLSKTTVEVHDAKVLRRNAAHRRRGHPDLQDDPLVLTIAVDSVEAVELDELAFQQVLAAGFRTTDEFREDWLARRLGDDVFVHAFRVVDDVRLLHARVHRGYTSDPAHAAFGEPEALSALDLQTLARREARRMEEAAAQAMRAQRRSIATRLKSAALRGDLAALGQATRDFAVLQAVTAGTATA
jgi:hypothetical protein